MYVEMEPGYKESKEVLLPKGLFGDVSDEAVSELCGLFPQMSRLLSRPGTIRRGSVECCSLVP